MTFFASVLYYSLAYLAEKPPINIQNTRADWYKKHEKSLKNLQLLFLAFLLILFFVFAIKHRQQLIQLTLFTWLLMLSFPVIAGLYYGFNHRLVRRFKLRTIGWLKPFEIGFCWAGMVTVYPAIYYCIINNKSYVISQLGLLLFIKNFMFVSVLSILFDIKDYASDSNMQLKTFIVKSGLRKTIFTIILPLSLIGYGSFLAWGINHNFSIGKTIINSIPFILLMAVAWSLQKRRSIFYYLIIIDGLMLIKAICGSIAALYF